MRTTFPPIFGLFAIFDRNFEKIVAPPSDEYESCVSCLKEQPLVEKTLKTASKSAYKRQRNARSNYAPLEGTVIRTRSMTPHLRVYSRRALYDLPQTLHNDRARRGHQKNIYFLHPKYSFSYWVHGKIGPS